jgi:hypothetical protein
VRCTCVVPLRIAGALLICIDLNAFECSVAPKVGEAVNILESKRRGPGSLVTFLTEFPIVACTILDDMVYSKIVHPVDKSKPGECWLVPKAASRLHVRGIIYRKFSSEVRQYLGHHGSWRSGPSLWSLVAARLACLVEHGRENLKGRGGCGPNGNSSHSSSSQASHLCATRSTGISVVVGSDVVQCVCIRPSHFVWETSKENLGRMICQRSGSGLCVGHGDRPDCILAGNTVHVEIAVFEVDKSGDESGGSSEVGAEERSHLQLPR